MLGNHVMYAVIKDGACYSFQHDEWFERLAPSCLTCNINTARFSATYAGGRVVTFKLEMLL